MVAHIHSRNILLDNESIICKGKTSINQKNIVCTVKQPVKKYFQKRNAREFWKITVQTVNMS